MNDSTEFAIEFRDTPVRELEIDEYLVYVRVFHNNHLENPYEIVVKLSDDINSLATKIFNLDQNVMHSFNLCHF